MNSNAQALNKCPFQKKADSMRAKTASCTHGNNTAMYVFSR